MAVPGYITLAAIIVTSLLSLTACDVAGDAQDAQNSADTTVMAVSPQVSRYCDELTAYAARVDSISALPELRHVDDTALLRLADSDVELNAADKDTLAGCIYASYTSIRNSYFRLCLDARISIGRQLADFNARFTRQAVDSVVTASGTLRQAVASVRSLAYD